MERKILHNHVNPLVVALILVLLFLMLTGSLQAQNVAINTDGSKADPNAILDIKSSTKGLLIPRMTTSQRIRIPQTNGLMVYDTNTKSFWYSNGETWQNMTATASADAWLITGNAGTVDGTNFLGTTDNVPLNIRVNNQRSGRIDGTSGNTFWGYRSGFSIATGNDNTGIGASALFHNTTGYNNTAVGSNALQTNSTGVHNTALGRFALMFNTTGSNNTAVGTASLFLNTTGANNTAIGEESLQNNQTGSYNTATGFQSLLTNTTGNHNTAMGYLSLTQNGTGFDNTAVGAFSLMFNTTGTWNTATGINALRSNTTGGGNTANGKEALQANTGGNANTAMGYETLLGNTTGSFNVAIGVFNLHSNQTGNENVGVGSEALYTNTSGNGNVAVGRSSMSQNTMGSYNVAAGVSSLQGNTTGIYNVGIGTASLLFNAAGEENTAVGLVALVTNAGGKFNASFGSNSLTSNTTGSSNTAIGAYSNVSANNLNNATALGYNAVVNASNKVRIGNAAVTVIEGQVPFTFPSDGRYKFGVQEDVKGLDFIMQLRPVTYQFDTKRFEIDQYPQQELPDLKIKGLELKKKTTDDPIMNAAYSKASSIRRSGFIAQEVEEAAKKSGYNFSGIIKPKTERDHYGLSYEAFVVPLVKGMQEQQKLIEWQKQENELQNKKIADLQNELAEIKIMLKASK